jgi:hypothetical protein
MGRKTDPPADTVLDEAKRLIYGDREGTYGHPFVSLGRIGRFWGVILDREPIEPEVVALMMAGLKISRLVNDPAARDGAVDLAGYAGLLERIDHHRRRLAGGRP